MNRKEILTNLCYYDLRNPIGVIDDIGAVEDIKEYNYGNYAQKDCYCDACFYGRTKLAEELLKYVSE